MITIYDATGKINRTVLCSEELLEIQCLEGEKYISGLFDPMGFYIDNGEAVPFPVQPSINHIFDYDSKSWIDPRSLEELKTAKWVDIKKARTEAEVSGFTWDGSVFDSDLVSQQRISAAIQMAGITVAAGEVFSITWTLQDNSTRVLSASDMSAVGISLGNHVAELHVKAQKLRASIDAATSPKELALIAW